MANVVVYVMTTWQNLPTKSSPVDATNLNHIEQGIKNVTDWVNTINMDKLYYVLPVATTSRLGGIMVDGSTITVDANGVITAHSSGVTEFVNLDDVEITDVQPGQVIGWDADEEKFVNIDVATNLADLMDVLLTDIQDGQIICWDATEGKFINVDVATNLADLLDVQFDNDPTDKQIIEFNAAAGKWVNRDGYEIMSYNDTMAILEEIL